jgi:DNA-binding beta-propeller fold protein YncE
VPFPRGTSPYGLAYDSAKGEIFVADKGKSMVSIISEKNNAQVENVTVGPTPEFVAYDPAQGEIYVTSQTTDSVVVLSDSASSTGAGTGGIKVTVHASDGGIEVGASVTSTSTPSTQAPLSGSTGSDGSVTFNGVVPGSYTLKATDGYIVNTVSTTVTSGNVASSSITLQSQSTGGTPSGGSSGGVPGYTYEEIIAGLVLGVVVIVWARRRQ